MKNIKRSTADRVLLILIAIWLSRAWIYLGDAETQEEINAPLIFFYQIFCQLICLYLMMIKVKIRDLISLMGQDRLLFILLLLSLVLLPFSTVFVNSFGMMRAVILLIVGTCYIRKRMSTSEIVRTTVDVAGVIVLLSVVAALIFPFGSAGGPHLGNWRGLFSHKNSLGEMSAFSLIITISYAIGYKAYRLRYALYVLMAGICLVMSGSATSSGAALVVVGFVLTIQFIARLPIGRFARSLFSIAFFLAVGFGAYYILDSAVELFGRDLTFTGRTFIWLQYLEFAAERPFTGWGWTASSNNESIVLAVRDFTRLSYLRTTHSIYVQMAVDFGYLFAAIYILWIFRTTISSFVFAAKYRSPAHIVRAAVAAGTLLIGGFESIVGIMPCLWFGLLLLTLPKPEPTLVIEKVPSLGGHMAGRYPLWPRKGLS
ncbi:hypothetical protein D9M68_148850 [compost metagenome]